MPGLSGTCGGGLSLEMVRVFTFTGPGPPGFIIGFLLPFFSIFASVSLITLKVKSQIINEIKIKRI